MSMYENFPYSNLHELNLNWLIEQLNMVKSSAVISVNGQTGDVILYQEPDIVLPQVDQDHWSVVRLADGTTRGIMFGNDDKLYVVHGNLMAEVYSQNNPPAYPVTSVNGSTGDVTLYPERNVNLPDVTSDQYQSWHIARTLNGISCGIRFDEDGSAYIINQGNRYQIYTATINEPTYPVDSVNGQTGTVVLFVDSSGNIQFPDFDNPNYQAWSIGRKVNNTNLGLIFNDDGTLNFRVGSYVYDVYTSNNPQAGFVSDDTYASMTVTEDSPSNYWGLVRKTTTKPIGIIFRNPNPDSPEAYLSYTDSSDTTQNVQLLTVNDLPATGVYSVNGLVGIVVLYSNDITISSGDNRSIKNALDDTEAILAVLEETNTAVHNISEGTYVIWKHSLYIATANIVVGDGLSASNLSQVTDTITDMINDHQAQLDAKPTIKSLGGISTNGTASIVLNTTAGTRALIHGFGTNSYGEFTVSSSDSNSAHIHKYQDGGTHFTTAEGTGYISITTNASGVCDLYAEIYSGDISVAP